VVEAEEDTARYLYLVSQVVLVVVETDLAAEELEQLDKVLLVAKA
jgi:hypothetical protein